MPSSAANAIIGVLHANARDSQHPLLEEEVLRLFDQMNRRLVGYARSFGISEHDGEDVVQDAFLALFRHLQQDRPRDNLSGWLFRVTHNLALKRRLRDQAHLAATVSCCEQTDPADNPEQLLLFNEKLARLQASLKALPATDQRCLRLRAEGLRYREIASILGISLGSVSASLARSLARLDRAERT